MDNPQNNNPQEKKIQGTKQKEAIQWWKEREQHERKKVENWREKQVREIPSVTYEAEKKENNIFLSPKSPAHNNKKRNRPLSLKSLCYNRISKL